MTDTPTLQDLVFEVADIQFTDNTEREAVRARDEARELVRKAHAAGAAAEKARVVALLTDEWTKWLVVDGTAAAIRADTLDDLLNRFRQ